MRLSLLHLFLLMQYNFAAKYNRICYFTNWGAHRSIKESRVYPEDIPADLCTHILYAFASLHGASLQPQLANDINVVQGEKPLYPRIMKLKQKNPELKILISCGGWGKAGDFDALVGSDSARETFSNNVISFCRQHGFDGIDLDWEFPSADHRQRFGLLAKTMRKIFKKEAKKSGKDELMISLAVAAGKYLITQGYDVPVLCANVDMINVMTYDLYGAWHNKIGHHSALFHRAGETGMERELNTNTSMYNWVEAGCSRDRLNIGIPGYGRAFSADGKDPFKAYGQSGGGSGGISSAYLGESGVLAYFEICRKELKEGFKRYWHDQHQIPISFKDGTWIGYDDPDSVRNKCKYVKREGFGGAMIWTLDMDDFNGQFCRKNKKQSLHTFPLVNAMKQEFEIDDLTTTTTMMITTSNGMNQSHSINDTQQENDDLQTLLDQMFIDASSSSTSTMIKRISSDFIYLLCLTSSYLIGSTITIVA